MYIYYIYIYILYLHILYLNTYLCDMYVYNIYVKLCFFLRHEGFRSFIGELGSTVNLLFQNIILSLMRNGALF